MRNGSLYQRLNDRRDVNDLWGLGELVASTEIDMLPRYGGDLRQQRGAGGVTTPCFMREQVGQDRRIIVNDAVGNEPATLLPQLLVIFRLEAELSEIGVGHRAAQLMVILPAIERPLDIPA